MENLREVVNSTSIYYNVIKPFFEIDEKLINLDKSTLFINEDCFKLNLYSLGNICCHIVYEVSIKQGSSILDIKLIIDEWEGAFETDFNTKSDTIFLDEKYIRAVLSNEIVVCNYY